MGYIKVIFSANQPADNDILVATLSEAGYIGFEETGDDLCAYIEEDKFNINDLNVLVPDLPFTFENIPDQNWNSLWEENFNPVIIDDYCTIRAEFHDIDVRTTYDIVITPKMSFGTGHHETTRLMINQLRSIDLNNKKVLDFGTGTGILAILASKIGASTITAIDNDTWAIENCKENVYNNHCTNINVFLSSIEEHDNTPFDIILANINKNVLLTFMSNFFVKLSNDGVLLLSGILKSDVDDIIESASSNGFIMKSVTNDNNWSAISFYKTNL